MSEVRAVILVRRQLRSHISCVSVRVGECVRACARACVRERARGCVSGGGGGRGGAW